MKLMVDNDLPHRMADALQCIFIDDEIISLRAKFGRCNVKDRDWITALGNEGGWAVVSADRRITRNRVERHAFLAAGLVGFFFSSSLKKSRIEIQTARLLTIWPEMTAQASLVRSGCFQIPASGKKFVSLTR